VKRRARIWSFLTASADGVDGQVDQIARLHVDGRQRGHYSHRRTDLCTRATGTCTFTPGIWILLLAQLPYGTRYSVEVSAPGPLACKVLKNAYLNGETITRWHRDDAGSSFAAPPATGSRCQSTPTALHTGQARTAGRDGLAASWPAPSRTRRSRSEATTGIIGQTRLAAEDRRRDVAALSGC
jgi:hypothetical protein